MTILNDELAQLQLRNTELLAQIAALKAAQSKGNGIKLNALGTKRTGADGVARECKGNISVYGLGKFPVSLYASQWKRLLAMRDDILKVIENAPEGALATKEQD